MNDCATSEEYEELRRLFNLTKQEVLLNFVDLRLLNTSNRSLEELLSILSESNAFDEEEKYWFITIYQTIISEQHDWNDLENILHLAEPDRYKNIVKLQIDVLKMVVGKLKELYEQKATSCLERFGKRNAVIKINKRKIEDTAAFGDQLPAGIVPYLQT
ncbi:unnamed protein product [Mytilus edulis]|uniref:Uncharacterized protein n=1 Tax=Mytilus edulis TaxID=6550 RepID=A0A8S3T9Z0_MYTED|nr:unnamed protein product [Mytilus edulis]